MRPIVLVAVALAGMSLTSTFADAGTWCGTFRLGSTSCGQRNAWLRCAALGDFATRIHFPGTAYGTSAGSWNSPNAPAARALAPRKQRQ
jgi:hypothetical protein